MIITNIHARQVLDSRGNPTIEVEVHSGKHMGKAIVPSGASTGIHEALELRDGGKKYMGKGVLKAVHNVNAILKRKLKNKRFTQKELDNFMIRLDGTKNKSKLGANAMLGVSMSFARCDACKQGRWLYEVLGTKRVMPVPFCNIINGGKHAAGKLAMQEFMIAPVKAKSFAEATRMSSEIYHILKKVIAKKYGKNAVHVGDEGGFAPPVKDAYQALNLITKALDLSGYSRKVKIAMDPAASEFYKNGYYDIGKKLNSEKMAEHYYDLMAKYPIVSLEDPFDQDDFISWKDMMKRGPKYTQIVGDDLLVTNIERIKMAKKEKLCNALLLKVNQIGTLTEAITAAKYAMKNKWHVMVSHRSGETEDPFIADLAVALGCGQIKLGAPCRSDRTSKYNQLLRIEEKIGKRVKYGR